MNKDRLNQFCRSNGLEPVVKHTFPEGEVYVAEGFTMSPEEIDPISVKSGDFPFGAYAVAYFIARGEDKIQYGPVLFFDAFHDKEEGWTPERKRQARLNKALEEARGFLKTREKVRLDA